MFGLSAEVGVALLASVAGRVEGAATAAVALGQRKKLLLPSSMSFSAGSKPVCLQNSHHVNCGSSYSTGTRSAAEGQASA